MLSVKLLEEKKMFGLGSIISKLAGPILDKMGLGFITPLVSAAVNFATGNYAALIGDVTNLVSSFSSSSFLGKAATKPTLGLFQNNQSGCYGSSSKLSLGKILGLSNSPLLKGFGKITGMLNVVSDFLGAFNSLQTSRSQAQYNFRG
jgi:hypothetical protein